VDRFAGGADVALYVGDPCARRRLEGLLGMMVSKGAYRKSNVCATPEEQKRCCGLIIDRVRIPADLKASARHGKDADGDPGGPCYLLLGPCAVPPAKIPKRLAIRATVAFRDGQEYPVVRVAAP